MPFSIFFLAVKNYIFSLQVQAKLFALKELEISQPNWEAQPHSALLNGNADHSSNSGSETANFNVNAEKESSAETEQINHESPVSSGGV